MRAAGPAGVRGDQHAVIAARADYEHAAIMRGDA
jgi:hypothetical protein